MMAALYCLTLVECGSKAREVINKGEVPLDLDTHHAQGCYSSSIECKGIRGNAFFEI